jgi:hypothetical protein
MFVPFSLNAAQKPARQILGIRLSMTKQQVHARLKEIGKFVRDVSLKQEVWTVRDPSFSNILIGFTKDDQLRYVSAIAREDKEAKGIPYAKIGDLKTAKGAGDPKIKVYNYQWHLPAENGEPETLVIALGREPVNLSTYSLKRLGDRAGEED